MRITVGASPPWWWRHCHQCCGGRRGAILGILIRSANGATAGQAMTTRPGTCWGGSSRREPGQRVAANGIFLKL